MTQNIDRARLTLMLNDLRLPAIKQNWPEFAERADKEGWPAARFLAALAEHEIAERDRRRLARHLAEAQLLSTPIEFSPEVPVENSPVGYCFACFLAIAFEGGLSARVLGTVTCINRARSREAGRWPRGHRGRDR